MSSYFTYHNDLRPKPILAGDGSHEYKVTGVEKEGITFEREMALIRQWRDRKDQKARDILVSHYILYAIKRIRQQYRWLTPEEVMTVAHSSLLDGIDKLNPDREKIGRLSTMIPLMARMNYRKVISERNTVRLPVKERHNGIGHFFSIDRPEYNDAQEDQNVDFFNGNADPQEDESDVGGTLASLLDLTESAAEAMSREELAKIVGAIILDLDPKLRETIKYTYFKGMCFAEIARKVKPTVTRERIRQRHNDAIRALRAALVKRGMLRSELKKETST